MENRLWERARAEPVFEGGLKWDDMDIWRVVASKLDGPDILRLSLASQWFWETLREASVWKQALLRRIGLVDAPTMNDVPAFPWLMLYSINFDGSHSYTMNSEGHLNWLPPWPLGGFMVDSHKAFLASDLLDNIGITAGEKVEAMLQSENFSELSGMKNGIWIADLHETMCSCTAQCPRSMLTFDARHVELFATKEYRGGQCAFISCGWDKIEREEAGFTTTAAIFDSSHIKDAATLGVFDIPSWEGIRHMVIPNGVAVKAYVEELHNAPTFTFFYEKMEIHDEVLSVRVSFVK